MFLDILGYSYKINQLETDEEATEIFTLLDSIEEVIKSYHTTVSNHQAYKEYDLHYAFLSDAVVISFTPKKNLNLPSDEWIFFNQTTLEFIFTWIMNVQITVLFQTGLLLRGGISVKDIFWKNNKVIGPGFIEAYNLERLYAKYPRIILSKELSQDVDLIDMINRVNGNGDSAYLKHILLKKDGEFYYYNFVGRLLARIVYGQGVSDEVVENIKSLTHNYLLEQKYIIESYLTQDEIYVEKYKWLRIDHNSSIIEFVDRNGFQQEDYEPYLVNA